jgi:hypothetical protein
MKNGDSLFTTIYENYNGHGRHPAALESAVRCQAAELSPVPPLDSETPDCD